MLLSVMKKITIQSIGVAVTSMLVIGCATGPEAQSGTVIGGIIGAATGGIVGHQSGRGLEGAAIGGGLGAIAGNMFGNAQDQRRSYYAPQQPAVYYNQPQVVYRRPAAICYDRPRVIYQSSPMFFNEYTMQWQPNGRFRRHNHCW